MSYGEAMATLARKLEDGLPDIQTALSLPSLDVDILSTTVTRFASIRLQDLGSVPGQNDAAALAQLDLRTPYDFDQWTVWQLQDKIMELLGFSRLTQVFRSFLPLLNFNDSDTAPPTKGQLRLDLAGSNIWQKRNDQAAGQNQYWLRLQLTYD
jgi:hypothetical protein